MNRKFADALLEEMEGEDHPVVLVQDYHFALLPRLIKERAPGCARGHLLAYSVAQPGSIRHLSLAARTAGRLAGRRSGRISFSIALQQFPGVRGPHAGIAGSNGSASPSIATARITLVRPFPISVRVLSSRRGRAAEGPRIDREALLRKSWA